MEQVTSGVSAGAGPPDSFLYVTAPAPPATADAPDWGLRTQGGELAEKPDEAGVERIRVVLAAPEDLFRDLLSTVLVASGKVAVVGAYPDAETAMDATRRLHPKVVVLDIETKGSLNGIQAGLLIRKEFPDVGIVWLSAQKRPYLPVSFQQQPAAGWAYLLKQSGTNVTALVAAVDAVAKGLVVLDAQIAESMNRLLNTWTPVLSPSQYDVLALMAQGFSNAAVAKAIDLPEKSVEGLINQIYRHLQLNSRTDSKHRRVETVLRYVRGAGEHSGAAGASQTTGPAQ